MEREPDFSTPPPPPPITVVDTPSNPPGELPYFPIWLRWAIFSALATGVIFVAGLYLLQQVNLAMSSNQALYPYVEWLIVLAMTALISAASTYAVQDYVKHRLLWFFANWVSWTIALEYPSLPVYFSYTSSASPVYQQASSIFSPIAKFLIIGFAQWAVLRINYRRAWTWMLWFLGGIAVSVGILLYLILVVQINSKIPASSANLFNWIVSGASYLIALLIAGFGLPFILRQPRLPEAERGREKAIRVFIATWIAAYLGYTILWYGIQSSGLLTLTLKPFQSTDFLARTLSYLYYGVVVGVIQWLVLRRWLGNAYSWLLATLIGLLLGKLASYGLGSLGSQPGNFLSNIGNNAFLASLVLTLATWVVLGIFQSGSLWVNAFPQFGVWFLALLTASLSSFLVSFYASQLLGLAIAAAITAYALADFFRRGLGESWVLVPAGETPTGPLVDADGEVIAQRAHQYFGPQARVEAYSDSYEVIPGSYVDRDMAQRVITGRGLAVVFASPVAPEEGQPLPDDSEVILDQDMIDEADIETTNDPDDVHLLVTVSEAGAQRLEAYKQNQPDQKLYLAVDGRVVISKAFSIEEGDTLDLPGLLPEEANGLAALLNAKPLTTAYRVENA